MSVVHRSLVCDRVRAQVSLGLDGELSQLETRMIAAHLSRCADCAAFEEDVRTFTSELRAAPMEQLEQPDRDRPQPAPGAAAGPDRRRGRVRGGAAGSDDAARDAGERPGVRVPAALRDVLPSCRARSRRSSPTARRSRATRATRSRCRGGTCPACVWRLVARRTSVAAATCGRRRLDRTRGRAPARAGRTRARGTHRPSGPRASGRSMRSTTSGSSWAGRRRSG